MLKTNTKYGVLIATLLVALVASVFTAVLQTRVMAATGNIYLSPASQTSIVGSNLTVNLRINPGTAVTVVQATVNFDPAKLQYVSINASNSPFDASVQQTVGGSSIQISRAKLDSAGVSSDSLIASITFKSLVSSGSSGITLSNANAAYNGAYTDPSVTNATVTFSPGTCPTGQTGTPPNCKAAVTPTKPTTTTPTTTTPTTPKPTVSTPATTPTPTPTPGKQVVSVPKITKQDVAYTKVVIEVSTEQDVRVMVRYGSSKDNLNIQSPLTEVGKTHSVTLDQGLSPAMNLFYQVVAQGAQGVTSQTDVQSIQTKGLSVKLALLGENLAPLRNQEVTIQPLGITGRSDGDGFVTFDSLPPGDFTAAVTYDGVEYAQHVGVVSNVETTDAGQSSAVLGVAVVYSGLQPKPTSVLDYWPIGLAILLVAVAVALAAIRPQWLKNLFSKLPFGRKPVPSVYPEIVAFGSANSVEPTAPVEPITPQENATPFENTNAAPAPYEPAPWEKPQQRGPF